MVNQIYLQSKQQIPCDPLTPVSILQITSAGQCNLVGFKASLDTIASLHPFDSVKAVDDYRNAVSIESLKISALITSGNQECTPQGIYRSDFIDSVFGIIGKSASTWGSLIENAHAYNQQINDSNLQIIDIFNREIKIDNNAIAYYNDSISSQVIYCGKPLQSDPESLKTIISTLQPGDTLFLDSYGHRSTVTFHAFRRQYGRTYCGYRIAIYEYSDQPIGSFPDCKYQYSVL